MKIRHCLAWLLALPVLLLAQLQVVTVQAAIPLPYERQALISNQASSSVIIGLALAGERLVAVGSRGVILLSDDNGQSWRQVAAPVSVSLTAVHFTDEHQGWAVGHSGIILHTQDAGESWTKQFDGQAAAESVAVRVKSMIANLDEEQAWALQDYAELLLEDGPDKPFLDVLFLDEHRGFVIGAFGLIFHTRDGGLSWHAWFEHVDNPANLHLYSIQANAKQIVIAGEQGLYLTSTNSGETFTRQQTPYDGSYFTATPLANDAWLLAGLRGNVFVHYPEQDRYQQLSVSAPVSFNAAITLDDGTGLLVNQAGQVFYTDLAENTVKPLPLEPLPPLANIIRSSDGHVVVAGYRGPVRLENVIEAVSRGAGE